MLRWRCSWPRGSVRSPSGLRSVRTTGAITKRSPTASVWSAALPVGPVGAHILSANAVLLGVSTFATLQTGLGRLFRRRRGRKKMSRSAALPGGVERFSIATFNIRGVMDRWGERQPLLRQCIKQMDADVLCMQEVLTGEYGQDRALLDDSYHVFSCKAALFNLLQENGLPGWYARTVGRLLQLPPARLAMMSLPAAAEAVRERLRLSGGFFRTLRDLSLAPFFGNSVACRLAEAHEIKHGTLVLGDWRAAQRIEFALNGNTNQNGHAGREVSPPDQAVGKAQGLLKVWVVNMHLDHDNTDNRHRQATAVCDWMEHVRGNGCAAVVLCGDMNAGPDESLHSKLRKLGYRSAYKTVHGHEPEGTWPTGIQAPFMDHGKFECLDYIYVWAAKGYSVRVLDAEVWGDIPAEDDATLYPSDHAAVRTTLEISLAANFGDAPPDFFPQ